MTNVFSQLSSAIFRCPKQIFQMNPFLGNCKPIRIPIFFKKNRKSLPFPHPWNYKKPIEILESFYCDAENNEIFARHNRYLDMPGFSPVLVTRDPQLIAKILTATGDRDGQFDRDTLPTTGIARATGSDTLLFGNGPMWRRQRKAIAPPFRKPVLFQDDIFSAFEDKFKNTARQRLMALRKHMLQEGEKKFILAVEPEIKPIMLEMLVECFFGTTIDYQEIREVYVPALERIIEQIVSDTVKNRLGIPRFILARFIKGYADSEKDFDAIEELTNRILEARFTDRGLWKMLQTDAPDEALRSNIRVILAGALEATTSFSAWAISHLARNETWQNKVYDEVRLIPDFTPSKFEESANLNAVLEETLRLTPSLYFLPRKATALTPIKLDEERDLIIPKNTHLLLDIWHANRHEDHWGEKITGYAADVFEPDRWAKLAENKKEMAKMLHFGFGHGSRICPGKHLGQLEVALVVGVFVKLFRFKAINKDNAVKAGVSTKPEDGGLVELELREPSAGMTDEKEWEQLMK